MHTIPRFTYLRISFPNLYLFTVKYFFIFISVAAILYFFTVKNMAKFYLRNGSFIYAAAVLGYVNSSSSGCIYFGNTMQPLRVYVF